MSIARDNEQGKYTGRSQDTEKRKITTSLLKSGHSYLDIQKTVKSSRQLIAVTSKELTASDRSYNQ